jgi:plasmid stabilization system protein ParE
MKFVIRPAARNDILRQYEYYLIEKAAVPAAERFVTAVQAAIAQVCRNPGIGAPRILGNLRLAGLRSCAVKGFPEIRVYYLVTRDLIRVVRVLHGKRDISPILEAE